MVDCLPKLVQFITSPLPFTKEADLFFSLCHAMFSTFREISLPIEDPSSQCFWKEFSNLY